MASITSSNTNGASVGYTYDDLNRLSTVVDNRLSGDNSTTYTYDLASNLATATYPNGLQSTFSYDSLNRLTALATPVSAYTYQLGPTGNRLSASEATGRTLNWTYDGIYRLTNEAVSSDPRSVHYLFGGHLMSGSKRPEKIEPGRTGQGSKAGALRCG